MATQIGPKIGIDGEKEYRAALKQIIDETKNLDAAMSKTASEWTKNTSAMTRNRDVAQNLAKQIDLQKEKISIINTMLGESAAKYGENATQTLAWQRALDHTTASLNNMQQELSSFKGAEGFSDLQTQFADVGTSLQNMGSKMAMVGGAMTAAITAPLVAVGKSSVEMASDMTEASSKVDVIFGNMSESVKSFADTSLETYGVSNVKAMEMVGTFGAMATQMGISDRAAAEMATTLTGLSGDLAAFHNSEIDITQTALEGIFTGQTRALTQFAGAINQANLEEFAAKQGKVYSKMTEGEKVMTRYALVLERTKDAQGNFAMTGGEFAGSMQKFTGAIQQLKVAIGEQLLPIITPIINKLTSMIQIFTNLPAPIQKIIVVLALLVAAIGPVILIIGTFTAALGAMITNIPIIVGALAALGPALASIAAAAGPVVLVILAMAAAFAAGYLIAENWDAICDSVSNAVSSMGSAISSAYNKIMAKNNELKNKFNGFAESLVDGFKELPSKIANAISAAIDEVKNIFEQMVTNAKKSGKDMVEGFVDGIKSKVSKVIAEVKKIAQNVKDFLGFSEPDKGPLSDFHTFAPDMMKLFAQGINQNKGIVTRALDGLAKEIALPLDSGASMNMALAGAGASSSMMVGGTTMNVYVDHINDLQDLINIQNQAQQRYRMGAK